MTGTDVYRPLKESHERVAAEREEKRNARPDAEQERPGRRQLTPDQQQRVEQSRTEHQRPERQQRAGWAGVPQDAQRVQPDRPQSERMARFESEKRSQAIRDNVVAKARANEEAQRTGRQQTPETQQRGEQARGADQQDRYRSYSDTAARREQSDARQAREGGQGRRELSDTARARVEQAREANRVREQQERERTR